MINNSLEGFQPQLTTLKFLFLIAFNKVCLYKKLKNAAVTHFRVAAAKVVQARRLYLQYCSSACSSCSRYA